MSIVLQHPTSAFLVLMFSYTCIVLKYFNKETPTIMVGELVRKVENIFSIYFKNFMSVGNTFSTETHFLPESVFRQRMSPILKVFLPTFSTEKVG